MNVKRWHDCLLIILVSAGYLLTTLGTSPLRILLALPFLLYFPGYAWTGALFAQRASLDSHERIGMSLGLSIALIPLLALLLYLGGFGLGIRPIVLTELATTGTGLALLAWRRRQLAEEAFSPHTFAPPLLVLLITFVVFGTIVYSVNPPSFYTEFYMQNRSGGEFARAVLVDETLSVELFIVNNERAEHVYHYELWVVDNWGENPAQRLTSSAVLTLSSQTTHSETVAWQMPFAGSDQQVQFYLYIDDDPQPYRQLTQWLDVIEP